MVSLDMEAPLFASLTQRECFLFSRLPYGPRWLQEPKVFYVHSVHIPIDVGKKNKWAPPRITNIFRSLPKSPMRLQSHRALALSQAGMLSLCWVCWYFK